MKITRVQILSGLVARCVLPKTCPPPLVGEKNVGSKLVLIYAILILSNCVILNFCAAPPGRIVNWCNVNSCS